MTRIQRPGPQVLPHEEKRKAIRVPFSHTCVLSEHLEFLHGRDKGPEVRGRFRADSTVET